MKAFCPECGSGVAQGDRFCIHCGKALAGSAPQAAQPEPASVGPQEAENAPRQPAQSRKTVRWSWVFKSAGIILAVLFSIAFLYGLLACPATADDESRSALPISLFIAGIFFGAMLAAYLSPGQTIREPAMGVALVAIVTAVLKGDFLLALVGWILPSLIGLLGALAGERLQRKPEATA